MNILPLLLIIIIIIIDNHHILHSILFFQISIYPSCSIMLPVEQLLFLGFPFWLQHYTSSGTTTVRGFSNLAAALYFQWNNHCSWVFHSGCSIILPVQRLLFIGFLFWLLHYTSNITPTVPGFPLWLQHYTSSATSTVPGLAILAAALYFQCNT